PLPRPRRSPAIRRPSPRPLPAATARCRLRNCPSGNPFHPPLGDSLCPDANEASGLLFRPELPCDRPVLAPLFVIVLAGSCQVFCEICARTYPQRFGKPNRTRARRPAAVAEGILTK